MDQYTPDPGTELIVCEDCRYETLEEVKQCPHCGSENLSWHLID